MGHEKEMKMTMSTFNQVQSAIRSYKEGRDKLAEFFPGMTSEQLEYLSAMPMGIEAPKASNIARIAVPVATEGPKPEKAARKARKRSGVTLTTVQNLLKKNPEGLRAEQIREVLGTDKEALTPVLSLGLTENLLRKRGQRRGTTYFLAEGEDSPYPNVLQLLGEAGESTTIPSVAKALGVPYRKITAIFMALEKQNVLSRREKGANDEHTPFVIDHAALANVSAK